MILETQILCTEPNGRAGQVLCLLYHCPPQYFVYSTASTITPLAPTPLLTALVKMPPAQPLI
jgi:hypothetical protein